MLDDRLRRWPNMKGELAQYSVYMAEGSIDFNNWSMAAQHRKHP